MTMKGYGIGLINANVWQIEKNKLLNEWMIEKMF